jgi:uncharacterized iron-regulated protein
MNTASLRMRICRLAATVATLVLSGCAGWQAEPEGIIEVASGREVTRAVLVERLRAADYVLLGELHDNRRHHALRGELVVDLGPRVAVVAEHLPKGRLVGPGDNLRVRLTAAGFDEKGWGWPAHEPLFAPILAQGLPVAGANAPIDEVRSIARGNAPTLPAPVKDILDAAPLSDEARAALEADLRKGHCGRLPAARVPAMRSAQRFRDATLWSALKEAGGRPGVLGNGHVRRDYGVPQLSVATLAPGRLLSVGLVESRADAVGAPYDYVWVTVKAKRDDPCRSMKAMQ